MKKFIFLMMLVAATALAGCANTDTENNNNTNNTDSEVAVSDVTAAPQFAEDADKNIDMDKVEGTDASTADDTNADGEVGETEVTITDAKVIRYNESDVVVVSFDFKNGTGYDTSFTGENTVRVMQGEKNLKPEVVVNVEGIDCNTIAQTIKNGDKITVQKAYRLSDTATPVTVMVDKVNTVTESGTVSKTFNLQ